MDIYKLNHSHDPPVSSCVPQLQAVNWQIEEAVQICKTYLRHKSIIGHHQHNCQGLRYIKTPKVSSEKSSKKKKNAGHLFPAITKKLTIHVPFQTQCN